jgi:hypothetical protein
MEKILEQVSNLEKQTIIDDDGTWEITLGDGYISRILVEPSQQYLDKIIPDEKMQEIRKIRNQMLQDTDWIIIRHYEQKTSGVPTSLPTDKALEWFEYRQKLRNLPNTVDIKNPIYPVKPS